MAERKVPVMETYVAIRDCTFNDVYYAAGAELTVPNGTKVPRHFEPQNVAIRTLDKERRNMELLATQGRRGVKNATQGSLNDIG